MTYIQGSFPLLKKTNLRDTVYDCTIHAPAIAELAQPGQFVHIRVDGFTLRRPISICGIDAAAGTLRLVFEVRGAGTARLSTIPVGAQLDLLGPLGHGFSLPQPGQKLILVGGGIGMPPLLPLAQLAKHDACVLAGFRTANAVILADDFRAAESDWRLATDDGTAGHHGLVTGLLKTRLEEGPADLICACGPAPMLRGIVTLAQQYGIKSEISLEERMGCGVGACLVCACKTVRDGQEIFSHVCKDGPVFDGGEVRFE